MAVVDASVLTAFYLSTDVAHDISRAWLETALRGHDPVTLPALALAEVAGAVARQENATAPGLAAVAEIVSSGVFDIVAVGTPLAQAAAGLAATQRIRGCDAVYVALAAQRREPLVTLDRQQLERGGAVVRVLTPAEALAALP